ncbi:hypothetical protein [Legionella nagasakiensis]|uniref:hypothetical protein n=1 Tax=Legionella nagasakiensis TaxID=535290 RepID=UPI0010548642|nr:hypothetical protein [Legionella nagasakiensis]
MPGHHIQLDVPMIVGTDGKRYPTTDHPPMIQNTAVGTIATMNILNPGSPLAPPVAQALFGTTRALEPTVDGNERMKQMARYIYKMAQQGVGLLALQEVPPPGSPEFTALKKELNQLNQQTVPPLINVENLQAQWKRTVPHKFGTTILCNNWRSEITSIFPYPNKARKQAKLDALERLLKIENGRAKTAAKAVERALSPLSHQQRKEIMVGVISTRTKKLLDKIKADNPSSDRDSLMPNI